MSQAAIPMSARLQRAVQIITSRNDLILAFFLVAVIFMMILPLPTWLVDALIGINMTISAILLMVAMYLPSPLAFSSFPSVLLVTTLFRLGISIATTRLILLQGDAGHIIFTFGNFVVGGNLVVGLVVFLILTIVQFVVITKGAERVAEVAARFSLDAMPGKQMSIDGDMRAGTIDMEEAKRRRGIVEKESQLYGAMDGAMKFVKGDAIAGLIIVAVNLLGGIVIGTMQRGMTAADAAKTYSVLTIGDGLIAQIPALKDGDYDAAFSGSVDRLGEYMELNAQGTPYEGPGMSPIVKALIVFGVPLLIALLVCLIFKRQMKTAVEATEADDYLLRDQFHVTASEDHFMYQTVTVVHHEHDSGTSTDSDGFSGSSGSY